MGLKELPNKFYDTISYSPCGILEEFIQQDLNDVSWHGLSFKSKENSELICSSDTLKRVKAKTDLTQIDDLIWKKNFTKDQVIEYIQQNYESL